MHYGEKIIYDLKDNKKRNIRQINKNNDSISTKHLFLKKTLEK